METQIHSVTIRDAGGQEAVYAGTYEADTEVSIACVAPATNHVEEDVAITVANIVAFFIVSDAAVTLKTNDNSVPDQTFVLTANKPLWWNTDEGANPLTVDITKLFFNNAGDADANVKCGFLVTDIP